MNLSASEIAFLMQLPVVGAFIWFTLRIMKNYSGTSKEVMADWRTFTTEQNALWREFLRDLREQQNTSTGRLAEEIKSISKVVTQLASVVSGLELRLAEHDVRVDARLSEQVAALRKELMEMEATDVQRNV